MCGTSRCSYPVTDFCIRSVEPSGSTTTVLGNCNTPGTVHVISRFQFMKVSFSFDGFSLNERLSWNVSHL
jgi:hypothetical protein